MLLKLVMKPTVVRRIISAPATVALVVALMAAALPMRSAGAVPLDDARTKVAEAQRAADEAAAKYEGAIGHLEELGAGISELEGRITAGRTEATALRAVAKERAVRAYVGRDTLAGGGFVLDGGDPLDEIRREKLLARTKAREDSSAERLRLLTNDLDRQRSELETRKAEQEQVVAQVSVEQARLHAQLGEAQQALDQLEEQLRAELEAAKAREVAAAAAREASTRAGNANGKDYSGAYVSTGIVCPVRGIVSFIDSWGYPRHQGPHMGVDLMAAAETPDVAVVGGEVTFKSGGMSGLGAYLHGDDGNLYYYFHLSAYEGEARHVAQGEVIGYVGKTGDAQYTAPHTHFEVHPGGGGAVNPYPSVRPVC
jgi:murein DD-endopeptidase MepM/ murein hydrolase activator NlpD